jgi:hypothetical protein
MTSSVEDVVDAIDSMEPYDPPSESVRGVNSLDIPSFWFNANKVLLSQHSWRRRRSRNRQIKTMFVASSMNNPDIVTNRGVVQKSCGAGTSASSSSCFVGDDGTSGRKKSAGGFEERAQTVSSIQSLTALTRALTPVEKNIKV